MSDHDDFISRLEGFEENNKELPESDMKFYQSLKASVSAIGELDLRADLDDYYHGYMKSRRNKALAYISGIAAVITLAGWFAFYEPTGPMNKELQMEQAPIYSDSSTYEDTLKKDQLNVDDVYDSTIKE